MRSEELSSKLKSFVLMGKGSFSFEEISTFSLEELEMFRVSVGSFTYDVLMRIPERELLFIQDVLLEIGEEMDKRQQESSGSVIHFFSS